MCRVIIDVDDIPIITAFNHLYCLLSTQMKNTFFYWQTVCGIWINGNYKMSLFIDCSKVYDVLENLTLIQSTG